MAPAVAAGLVAATGTIGADCRWFAALGRAIVHGGGVPSEVAYATADSSGWHDVPAAGQVLFFWLHALAAERGFLLAQVLAVFTAVATLGVDARRRVRDGGALALVVVAVLIAAFPAFAVVRVQLFSLALFPLLVALLRREQARRSARIWLCVPLFAVWSNLHGAVLIGFAVAAVYLVVDRVRWQPVAGVLVLLASAGAICATPAGLDTIEYYRGVLSNEAAKRGIGLWAPLSLSRPFDIVLAVGALLLVTLAIRSRPPLWELVALAALVALTIETSRSGVWLLLFAATPAAAGVRTSFARLRPFAAPLTLIAVAVVVASLVRGPFALGASPRLIAAAITRAGDGPVVAEGALAEQVALRGGRVWMSNPLDAFRRSDQALYLDWLEGRPDGDAALSRGRVALVQVRSKAQRRLARRAEAFELARDDEAVLYAVR